MTLFKHTNPWEGEVEHVYDGPDPLLDHGACFVPVEPCEHGNYARHIPRWSIKYSWSRPFISWTWCPGAGIGGDDAT